MKKLNRVRSERDARRMQGQAPVRLAVVALASLLCIGGAGPASAIGFGSVSPVATLGQPLDLVVPVTTEAGERFDADCVKADVSFGDNHLAPNQFRVQATPAAGSSWRVHVTSTVAITEPVVEVALTAGCDRAFTRRFTAFADPPLRVARGGAPVITATPATGAIVTAQGVAPNAVGPATELAAASDGSLRALPSAGARSRAAKGPTRAAAAALARRAAGPAETPAAATPGAVAAARPPAAGTRAAAAALASADRPRLVLDSGFAHLKMDLDDPVVPPVSAAASGAAATIGLSDLDADPDLKRVQALESSLQALRRETQVTRDQTAALKARLAQAEERGGWLPLLLAALGVSVAAAGVLGWRLRQQMRARTAGSWFADSALAVPGAVPVSPPVVAPERTPRAERAEAAAYLRGQPEDAGQSVAGELVGEGDASVHADSRYPEDLSATQPLSRAAMAAMMGAAEASGGAAARELSVEELLDLEQQADFFIALGQEDAAVDLLMSHLRSAGGQSPLPYTKLLEIYRRQGDRAAYERTRARFNRRFNAYAPDWDVGPGAGRTLEDYPETIARVQAAWPSPIDAMAILEALLFKRDDTSELFDLPAYRDVLVLYALARDLWQQSSPAAGSLVDVLLPLDDLDGPQAFTAPGASTAPAPLSTAPLPELSAHFGDRSDPAAPVAAVPAPDPGLPSLDEGLLPSRVTSDEPPAFELTGFELLAEHPEGGGVQATLDASHLNAPRGSHGPEASNDESSPRFGPGTNRGPSSSR